VVSFGGCKEGIIPLTVKWFVEDGVDDVVVEGEERFYLCYCWSCEVADEFKV